MHESELQRFCTDLIDGRLWNIADITHEQLEILLERIGWSYAVTWSLSSDNGFLVWRDGIFNLNHNKVNSQSSSPDQSGSQRHEHFLFTLYKSCVFDAGQGFAGVAFQRGQHLWISDSRNLEISTVSKQRQFLKAANIETILCLPRQDGVLELGSVYQIQNEHNFVPSIENFFLLERSNMENAMCDNYNYSTLVNHDYQDNDSFLEGNTQSNSFDICDNYINYSSLVNHDHEDNDSFFEGHTQSNSFESSQLEPNTTLVNSTTSSYEFDLMNKVCEGPCQVYENQRGFKKWDQLSTPVVLRTQGSQMMLKKSFFILRKIRASQVERSRANELLNSVPSHGSRLKRSYSLNIQDVANNHKIAERKRRKKQNQQFNILRSLIPNTSKSDKLSILQNTIGYLKEVKSKAESLEQLNRELQSYISSKTSFAVLPQGQINDEVKEKLVPSSVLTIEEKFFVFKKQILRWSMDTSGSKMDIIKVDQIQERSITIAVCCQKRSSDILIQIISSLLSMGLEISSCFHASILNGLYIFMTTHDTVVERNFQQLTIEVEKILNALLTRFGSI